MAGVDPITAIGTAIDSVFKFLAKAFDSSNRSDNYSLKVRKHKDKALNIAEQMNAIVREMMKHYDSRDKDGLQLYAKWQNLERKFDKVD
jgi:hypothetical protein